MIRKLEFKALDSKKTFQHRVVQKQIAFKVTGEGKLGKNKDSIYFQNSKEQNSRYKIEKINLLN